MVAAIRFIGLLLTSLLVGTMFGVWLGFDPRPLTASAYVEMQQNAIRALNVTLPVLGLVCVVLNAVLAWLTRDDKRDRLCLLVALILLVAAGLITRLENQPINALVITWSPQSPPATWQELRDVWWQWHSLRTAAAVLALGFLLFSAVFPAKRAAA